MKFATVACAVLIVAAIGAIDGLKLPSDVDKYLYCAGCEAVVKELSKALAAPSADPWEVRVVDKLDTICDQDNFKVYDYIPPKMVKACKHLLDTHEEDIEGILIKHYRVGMKDGLKQAICNKMSKACKGVDKKKAKSASKARIHIDGQEKEVDLEQGPAKVEL